MFCCGNFSRCRLWLHTWAAQAWEAVDARDGWIAFDGREFHLTEEWEGPERYSLVYFTHPAFRSPGLSPQERAHLLDLGFPWPEEEHAFTANLPRPRERRSTAWRALPPDLAAWEQTLPA